MDDEIKFSGRCSHGNLPGSCRLCNPPIPVEEVIGNLKRFLKPLRKIANKLKCCGDCIYHSKKCKLTGKTVYKQDFKCKEFKLKIMGIL